MGDTPYRDGLQALVGPFEEARERARRRAAALGPTPHKRVPVKLLREIDELDATLDLPLESVEAVAQAEALLQRYEGAVDAAFAIAEAKLAQQDRSKVWRRLAWGVLAVVLPLLSFWGIALSRRYDAYEALCRQRCDVDGRCHPRWLDVVYDRNAVPQHDHDRCIATSAADCEAPCRVWGRCGLVGDVCSARGDEDCRHSDRCRDEGECHEHRAGNVGWHGATHWLGVGLGICAIRTRQDCEQSRACVEDGRCRVGNDSCVE